MSECRFVAKVAKRFQITIPKPVRELLNINEGDVLEVSVRIERKNNSKK